VVEPGVDVKLILAGHVILAEALAHFPAHASGPCCVLDELHRGAEDSMRCAVVAVGFALGSECPIRALPDMPDATGQRAHDYYCSEVGVFEKREYLDLYHHVLAIIITQSKTVF